MNLPQRWVKAADDGDHFRLAFDKPGTWSQKYNLVWDRILGLNLFPAAVARKGDGLLPENAKPIRPAARQPREPTPSWTGRPGRRRSRKTARTLKPWSIRCIAFLNATPDRTPMTDWYETKTARQVGFDARPVVGGVFLQMLYNKHDLAEICGA